MTVLANAAVCMCSLPGAAVGLSNVVFVQNKTIREVRKAVGEGKTPSGGMTSKLQEPLPSTGQAKPARTGAIKPQAVKVEEGKA